jgi:hypothetical protein
MFTVQTERPTQAVGLPAALMLGVIAALAITAFAVAVPHTRHVPPAPGVAARCASGCFRGGRDPRMPARAPRADGRYLRAEHSYGAVP